MSRPGSSPGSSCRSCPSSSSRLFNSTPTASPTQSARLSGSRDDLGPPNSVEGPHKLPGNNSGPHSTQQLNYLNGDNFLRISSVSEVQKVLEHGGGSDPKGQFVLVFRPVEGLDGRDRGPAMNLKSKIKVSKVMPPNVRTIDQMAPAGEAMQ